MLWIVGYLSVLFVSNILFNSILRCWKFLWAEAFDTFIFSYYSIVQHLVNAERIRHAGTLANEYRLHHLRRKWMCVICYRRMWERRYSARQTNAITWGCSQRRRFAFLQSILMFPIWMDIVLSVCPSVCVCVKLIKKLLTFSTSLFCLSVFDLFFSW